MCMRVHACTEDWEGGGRGEPEGLPVVCLVSQRILVTFANTSLSKLHVLSHIIVRHITIYLSLIVKNSSRKKEKSIPLPPSNPRDPTRYWLPCSACVDGPWGLG